MCDLCSDDISVRQDEIYRLKMVGGILFPVLFNEMEFEYKGHKIKVGKCEDFVWLGLKQPNGDVWASTSGYCHGAGHTDYDF